MEYNVTTINEFKGHRVRVQYTTKGVPCSLAAYIIYMLDEVIIVRLAGGKRVSIKYKNIDNIEKIQSFEYYLGQSLSLFNKGMYQQAFDVIFRLKEFEVFKLPEQLKIIDNTILKCKEELFKIARKEPKNLDEAIKEEDVMELREKLKKIENEQ